MSDGSVGFQLPVWGQAAGGVGLAIIVLKQAFSFVLQANAAMRNRRSTGNPGCGEENSGISKISEHLAVSTEVLRGIHEQTKVIREDLSDNRKAEVDEHRSFSECLSRIKLDLK